MMRRILIAVLAAALALPALAEQDYVARKHVKEQGDWVVKAAGDFTVGNDLEVNGDIELENDEKISNSNDKVVKVKSDAGYTYLVIEGNEGQQASLLIKADDGDDAPDTMNIRKNADNTIDFYNGVHNFLIVSNAIFIYVNEEQLDNSSDKTFRMTFNDVASEMGLLDLYTSIDPADYTGNKRIELRYVGNDDQTNETVYGGLYMDIDDETDTSEDSTVGIKAMSGGEEVYPLQVQGADVKVVEGDYTNKVAHAMGASTMNGAGYATNGQLVVFTDEFGSVPCVLCTFYGDWSAWATNGVPYPTSVNETNFMMNCPANLTSYWFAVGAP